MGVWDVGLAVFVELALSGEQDFVSGWYKHRKPQLAYALCRGLNETNVGALMGYIRYNIIL